MTPETRLAGMAPPNQRLKLSARGGRVLGNRDLHVAARHVGHVSCA
jgi:hypothetical protein